MKDALYNVNDQGAKGRGDRMHLLPRNSSQDILEMPTVHRHQIPLPRQVQSLAFLHDRCYLRRLYDLIPIWTTRRATRSGQLWRYFFSRHCTCQCARSLSNLAFVNLRMFFHLFPPLHKFGNIIFPPSFPLTSGGPYRCRSKSRSAVGQDISIRYAEFSF